MSADCLLVAEVTNMDGANQSQECYTYYLLGLSANFKSRVLEKHRIHFPHRHAISSGVVPKSYFVPYFEWTTRKAFLFLPRLKGISSSQGKHAHNYISFLSFKVVTLMLQL